MPGAEFSLIESYFYDIGPALGGTVLAQGDDAAVVEVPRGYQLVMSIDTLIGGVHFPQSTSPADIAHKALAVNLSDLAAMAATPAWFLLSISLPNNDEDWLKAFSQSLNQIARQYEIELIGGDTCHGPLSITVQVNGLVEKSKFISRSGARAGDLIVVSGQLGNAAVGLAVLQKKISLTREMEVKAVQALNRPSPRLCLTGFLQEFASAAIDLSDGLVGDLRHILDRSGVGAKLYLDKLPVNEWINEERQYDYALGGGDDYELCFTMNVEFLPELEKWNLHNKNCPLSVIGEITESGYRLHDQHKVIDLSTYEGYQHFGE